MAIGESIYTTRAKGAIEMSLGGGQYPSTHPLYKQSVPDNTLFLNCKRREYQEFDIEVSEDFTVEPFLFEDIAIIRLFITANPENTHNITVKDSQLQEPVVISGESIYMLEIFRKGGKNLTFLKGQGGVGGNTVDNTPSELTAMPAIGEIALSWTDNSNQTQGFEIWRREKGEIVEEFVLVDTTASAVSSYTDNTVIPAKEYQYRIKLAGEELFSNIATVTATPAIMSFSASRPENITATGGNATWVHRNGTSYLFADSKESVSSITTCNGGVSGSFDASGNWTNLTYLCLKNATNLSLSLDTYVNKQGFTLEVENAFHDEVKLEELITEVERVSDGNIYNRVLNVGTVLVELDDFPDLQNRIAVLEGKGWVITIVNYQLLSAVVSEAFTVDFLGRVTQNSGAEMWTVNGEAKTGQYTFSAGDNLELYHSSPDSSLTVDISGIKTLSLEYTSLSVNNNTTHIVRDAIPANVRDFVQGIDALTDGNGIYATFDFLSLMLFSEYNTAEVIDYKKCYEEFYNEQEFFGSKAKYILPNIVKKGTEQMTSRPDNQTIVKEGDYSLIYRKGGKGIGENVASSEDVSDIVVLIKNAEYDKFLVNIDANTKNFTSYTDASLQIIGASTHYNIESIINHFYGEYVEDEISGYFRLYSENLHTIQNHFRRLASRHYIVRSNIVHLLIDSYQGLYGATGHGASGLKIYENRNMLSIALKYIQYTGRLAIYENDNLQTVDLRELTFPIAEENNLDLTFKKNASLSQVLLSENCLPFVPYKIDFEDCTSLPMSTISSLLVDALQVTEKLPQDLNLDGEYGIVNMAGCNDDIGATALPLKGYSPEEYPTGIASIDTLLLREIKVVIRD